MTGGGVKWRAALYVRLSREDGDKAESDSIANQKKLLEAFVSRQPDMEVFSLYSDDGWTGTSFDRPAFRRMIADLDAGRANCVIVKDLSRFGRDYIGAGRYLERWFPQKGIRFIAPGDGVDSETGPYDMLLPIKNVINEQYARDISQKVRTAFRTKREQGEFLGAFAPYGYRKDPEDHSRLLIDPPAAETVKRIYALFRQGMGKQRIAKKLNGEGIPCPSEYKRLGGERYRNGRRLETTVYWTYSTVHRILTHPVYGGDLAQGRCSRQGMHGKAKQLDRDCWTVVRSAHEAIIPPGEWQRTQELLALRAREPDPGTEDNPFAGLLRCGDCGRAMSKTGRGKNAAFCCGSYKRCGPSVCSRHALSRRELERVLRDDLDALLASVPDLDTLAEEAEGEAPGEDSGEAARLRDGLERLFRMKKTAYEDWRAGLIGREDYLRYKADYEEREERQRRRLDTLERQEPPSGCPWMETLLATGRLPDVDRIVLSETVREILVFEDRLEITYSFAGPGEGNL